jgi:hypothetical protein
VGTVFDHYQVQIATDAVFTTIVQDTEIHEFNQLSYIVNPALQTNQKYFWRVRAWNTSDQSSLWSSIYYFRIALPAPTLTYPAEGEIVTGYRPVFDWSDQSGASSYTIQVSTNNTFTSLWVNATAATSSYTPLINLPVNTLFYWRVRTNGINGPSPWTSSTFRIIP